MREITATICLLPPQRVQLLDYCASYRSYLWQCLSPTPERNQLIRHVQIVQGYLEKAQEQGQAETRFLAREECQTISQLLSGLTRAYGQAPPSAQRTQQLGELLAFRRQLNQRTPANATRILHDDRSRFSRG